MCRKKRNWTRGTTQNPAPVPVQRQLGVARSALIGAFMAIAVVGAVVQVLEERAADALAAELRIEIVHHVGQVMAEIPLQVLLDEIVNEPQHSADGELLQLFQ